MEMSKQKKRRKQRKRKRQRRKQKTAAIATQLTQQPQQSAELWSSTYMKMLQWHREQVQTLCRAWTVPPESSTDEEDFELQEEHSAQSVNFEEDVDQVDADYLNFLQVTIKHREELKRSRAAAADNDTESATEA